MSDEHCVETQQHYDFEKHWNTAYLKTPVRSLGWFEDYPAPSLELIDLCELEQDASIFNAGAGATTLIEALLEKGFNNLIINDIAASALSELKLSLSDYKHVSLKFIVDDLTRPSSLLKLKDIDLWHDRAVLHFFTKKEQQDAYFDLIRNAVKLGGYVILAEFNKKGARKCANLPIFNYNKELLTEGLGTGFRLIKAFDYSYTQPSGDTRAYVYTLFQRTA